MNNVFDTLKKSVAFTRALTDPALKKLVFPLHYGFVSPVYTPTFYRPQAFEKNLILGYGDSLADGFMDNTHIKFAPGEHITQQVKKHFGKQWEYKSYALNGSTADYVHWIMEQTDLKDAVNNHVDIILSAGANNIRVAVEKLWDKAEIVFKNPFHTSALVLFAKGIIESIDVYEHQMIRLLKRLQAYKISGRKINRVFIEGIPNMAHAQAIFLPGKDPIKLEGTILSWFARNISYLLNASIISAIKKANITEFDVIFKDNAKVITPATITLMHPNKTGYKNMGDLQLKHSFTQFPDGKYSLWDKIVD